MHRFLSRFVTSRRFGLGAVTVALGLLAASSPFASAGVIDDLRGDTPSGEEVRREIERLSDDRDQLLSALNTTESELTRTIEARELLDEDQRRLASQIEAATDTLESVAVRAFVSGGRVGELSMLVNVAEVSDLSWRSHLIRNHAASSEVALARLVELEAQASDEVRESVEVSARLREEIAGLEVELDELEPMIAEARELQPLADAWDRAAIAIEEGSYGVAPEEKWEQLRFCESTHDYRAISPTGAYRGAYQFDLATWQTVGGTGDPVDAPPEEQDARARELYARRGHEPWPECGFHLQ